MTVKKFLECKRIVETARPDARQFHIGLRQMDETFEEEMMSKGRSMPEKELLSQIQDLFLGIAQ